MPKAQEEGIKRSNFKLKQINRNNPPKIQKTKETPVIKPPTFLTIIN